MTAFGTDSQPNGPVTSVTSPTGGSITFDQSLNHTQVGTGWATWSNGYTGDVYTCTATESTPCTTLVITLPANTVAFYFYVEPNRFATFTVTATLADNTTSGPVSVAGNAGATYFGFYTT